jgi:hypothetical protein
MGSSFFGNVTRATPFLNGSAGLNVPGMGGNWNVDRQRAFAPGTGGPYMGVDPTLAGANAGYGGAVQPGANPAARPGPISPYQAK